MDLGLTGKTVLVCASSAGLGKATALEFAREGAKVMLCGRRAAELERAVAEIAAAQPEAVLIFTEEDDHPVDVPALVRARGWERLPVIVSDIARGRIVIHDGPSILESARWLADELAARGLFH